MKSKYWKIVFYGAGFFPLTFIITIFTFYFHTAAILNHLPIPSLNDPKNLEIYSFYSPIIYFFFFITGYLIPVWILVSIIYLIKHFREPFWRPWVVASLIYLFAIGLIFTDVISWFLD